MFQILFLIYSNGPFDEQFIYYSTEACQGRYWWLLLSLRARQCKESECKLILLIYQNTTSMSYIPIYQTWLCFNWCVFIILEASYNDKKSRGVCNAKWESTADLKDMPNSLKSALESRNVDEKVTSDSQYQFKTLCVLSCMTFFLIFVLTSSRRWRYTYMYMFFKSLLNVFNKKYVHVYQIIEIPYILKKEEH